MTSTHPRPTQQRLSIEDLNSRVPFLRLIGAYQDPNFEDGIVRVHLKDLREDLCNQLPAAHGGILMTLLDVAMSRAAVLAPGAPASTAVTVEMSSRFIRPGRGPLLAEGRVINQGRSLCTCEANIYDQERNILATAQGTFKYWMAHAYADTAK